MAKSLEIAPVVGATTLSRHDVVHLVRGHNTATIKVVFAEWMSSEERLAESLPRASVATLRCAGAGLRARIVLNGTSSASVGTMDGCSLWHCVPTWDVPAKTARFRKNG